MTGVHALAHGPAFRSRPVSGRRRSRGAAAMMGGLIAMAAFSVPYAGAQEVRGLVIGIDRYVEMRDLGGAVNDARDIASALIGTGTDDVVVLEDADASRDRIATEWRALLARSHPGDAVVLTFSGHGAREPARLPEHEPDGFDEVLLLSAFTSKDSGRRERIVDDELHEWFAEAGERGLRVIFVADTSYSGGLLPDARPYSLPSGLEARQVVPPALRYAMPAQYAYPGELLELDAPEPAATLAPAALPHVTLLAATREYQPALELMLPDDTGHLEPRGALSYHFARALRGAADVDQDAVLRRDELWRHVRDSVRLSTEWDQHPRLVSHGDDTDLLRLSR